MPVYIRTGKGLPRRTTEVVMEFRRPPHLPMFPAKAVTLQPDALVARVQPNEGVSLRFGAKVPGHEFRIRKASMDFSYSHGNGESRDEAYERAYPWSPSSRETGRRGLARISRIRDERRFSFEGLRQTMAQSAGAGVHARGHVVVASADSEALRR